jgi:hypothetical protein
LKRREELKTQTLARRRHRNHGMPGLEGLDRAENPPLRRGPHCAIYAEDVHCSTSAILAQR